MAPGEGQRPEWVACIKAPPLGLWVFALCGRRLGWEFAYQDAEHARGDIEREGRLVLCEECARIANLASPAP
jgi:hypothetical protein